MRLVNIINKTKKKSINDFNEGDFFLDMKDNELMVKIANNIKEDGIEVNAFSITKQDFYFLEDEELIGVRIESIEYVEV